MTASARSPLRSLRSLHGERATPSGVNSQPDTLSALKPGGLYRIVTMMADRHEPQGIVSR